MVALAGCGSSAPACKPAPATAVSAVRSSLLDVKHPSLTKAFYTRSGDSDMAPGVGGTGLYFVAAQIHGDGVPAGAAGVGTWALDGDTVKGGQGIMLVALNPPARRYSVAGSALNPNKDVPLRSGEAQVARCAGGKATP